MACEEANADSMSMSNPNKTGEEEDSSKLKELIQQQKEETEPKNENQGGEKEDKAPEVIQKDTLATGDNPKEKGYIPSSALTSPRPLDGAVKSSLSPKKTQIGSPNYNLMRFPLRVGITWKKGERLEAMDFSRTWYPSKIVDIDEEEKFVLIHFEGWNSRYDEWVSMASDKLRPQTRHSERKDKNSKKCRNHPQPIYRPGEAVLARWTDCKKYPGKISRIMSDGTFEVIFYDGVCHYVQPINIQPLPEEMKLAADSIQIPPSPPVSTGQGSQTSPKSSFKNIKLQLPESVVKRTKSDADEMLSSKIKKLPTMEKKNRHMEKSIKKSLAHISGTFKKSPLKAHRLKAMQGSPKALLSQSSTSNQTTSPSFSSSLPVISSAATVASIGTAVTPPSSGKLVMVIKKDQESSDIGSILSPITLDPTGSTTLPAGVKRVNKRAHTDSSLTPRKKKKHKLKEAGLIPKRHVIMSGQRAHSLDLGGSPAASSSPHIPVVSQPQFFVPSKAFVVEEDHNPYKCPFEGCTKEFRKESLLTYHIKYYHTNPETNPIMTANTSASSGNFASTTASMLSMTGGPLSPLVTSPHAPIVSPVSLQNSLHTPVLGHRRRRRKTDSFCSTDSDVSVSSKGKSSSKRQRHDSEISVTGSPDLISRDLWADVKLKAPQDSLLEEYGETEEEDVEPDLVNCVCQIRETNGLMIQCDICMCWQHFTCVDTEGTGRPPTNYVCLACERPKGVRDSCKYMYDMGWERRGELPGFPFLNNHGEATTQKTERLKQVATNCNMLTSTLLGIKAVLHSMKRQIKISKEEDEPEFQLWQTDWDNWTKPEEDLTLTPPHSVEAAPSPAPSTFMFPQAPSSPLASTLAPTVPLTTSSSILQSSPGLDYMTSTSAIPTASSLSMSSFSLPSSYQDTFKSWLSAKDSPPSLSVSSPLKSESGRTKSISTLDGVAISHTDKVTSPETSGKQSYQSNPLTPPLGLGQTSSAPPLTSCQSSPLTPPMSSGQTLVPPQTPQSVRSSRVLSMNDQKEGHLARDLFAPGPGGDASNVGRVLSCPGGHSLSAGGDNQEEKRDSGQRQSDSTVSEVLTSSSPKILPTTTASTIISLLSSTSSVLLTLSTSLSTSTLSSSLPFFSTLPVPSSTNSITKSTMADVVINNKRGEEMPQVKTELLTSDNQKGRDKTHIGQDEEIKALSDQAALTSSQSQSLHELFVDVNSGDTEMNADDVEDDNDTDTAEESADPYRDCEKNLLVHISRTHNEMESQLEELEIQIGELENSDLSDPTIQLSGDNVLNDVPALKKSLGKLVRSLGKIQHLSLYR